MSDFEKELEALLNKYSMENGSNTPDFILATYLVGCLRNYNTSLQERDKWYGFKPFEKPEQQLSQEGGGDGGNK